MRDVEVADMYERILEIAIDKAEKAGYDRGYRIGLMEGRLETERPLIPDMDFTKPNVGLTAGGILP